MARLEANEKLEAEGKTFEVPLSVIMAALGSAAANKSGGIDETVNEM